MTTKIKNSNYYVRITSIKLAHDLQIKFEMHPDHKFPSDLILTTNLACTDKSSKQHDLFTKTFYLDESDELEDLVGRKGWVSLVDGQIYFIDNMKIDPIAAVLPFSYGYKFPSVEWD